VVRRFRAIITSIRRREHASGPAERPVVPDEQADERPGPASGASRARLLQ
jgi:hypothetical protein